MNFWRTKYFQFKVLFKTKFTCDKELTQNSLLKENYTDSLEEEIILNFRKGLRKQRKNDR